MHKEVDVANIWKTVSTWTGICLIVFVIFLLITIGLYELGVDKKAWGYTAAISIGSGLTAFCIKMSKNTRP